jgi:multicomponent Na+:H+ antiporter subunit G
LWTDLLVTAAIVVGTFFMFVASLGVFRLSDFYLRVHAPTKAATLGLIFLLTAVALDVREKTVVTKAVLALVFIGVTAPVGGHILTRAAYRNGIPASPGTRIDEYAPLVHQRKLEPDHFTPADEIDHVAHPDTA